MRRLLFWLMVLVVVGGTAMYLRPVWVSLQLTHLTFALKGVQSDYVETPEGRIHYYDAEARISGGGTPIVLVHGLGDRSEAWAPMIYKLRSQGFHVYALDLLGYGRSPKPADADYSMALQAKVVADFIHGLGLERTDVAGWSMGGWASILLALDHPEMVDRLVVFDSAGVDYPRTYPDTVFHPTNEAELDRLVHLLEPSAKPLSHFIAKDALRKFAGQQWVIDRGIAAMLTKKDALETRLPTLQAPLLIVWGEDDRLLPLATVGEKMHELDPKSELDVMQGCGHLVPAVCTTQAASATVDFLKAMPAKQGGMRTWGPSSQ
ncbi:alpha/beta fold hydrolase [Granulicella paludicola]|uniref:alpha/beta fold hydrolase n=1 Tax=Granulicella paludicola TaxID=474951 RepID=UPI0021DF5CBF|nr:alpha/beta hydrolase [Granulicella paludicola]